MVDSGDATGFWEPGPTVTPPEWSLFLAEFRELLGPATVVTLSGSLPPGVPLDGYATLIALAASAGVPTVLDSSGPALLAGMRAAPSVAKPNTDELAALLGTLCHVTARRPGPHGLAEAVRSVAAGPVVVSRGAAGLLAVIADEVWECAPPVLVEGNPTGAGDACVAALARGLRDHVPWPDLLSDAVALSAAAVAAPVAGAFDPDVYRRTRVTATPAGGSRAGTHR